MKVSKWVDMGAEIEIDINLFDIRSALSEAFEQTEQKFDEPPTIQDILRSLSLIGTFVNAFNESQIARLNPAQRSTIAAYLANASERFKVSEMPA